MWPLPCPVALAASFLLAACQVSHGLSLHQHGTERRGPPQPRKSTLLPPPPRARPTEQRGASLAARAASVRSRAAARPINVPAAKPCEEKNVLKNWFKVDERDEAIIKAWQAKRPGGLIERLAGGEDNSCLVSGVLPEDGNAQFLSLVKEPEAVTCKETETPVENWLSSDYPVSGAMTQFGDTREVRILWPDSGCSVEAPCPLVLFFHACGAGQHGLADFAKYDKGCAVDQGSIIVFPMLYSNESFIEYWTAPENEVFDRLVMPLWESISTEYAGFFDVDRVSVGGSSMGSGMALMVALKRPDIFSAVVAAGLTDGATCTLKMFNSAIFGEVPVSPLPGDWRLRYVAISVGELEDVLPLNKPWRINATLDLLDTAGVTQRAAVNLRLYHGMVHVEAVRSTYDHWAGLYDFMWRGDWSVLADGGVDGLVAAVAAAAA